MKLTFKVSCLHPLIPLTRPPGCAHADWCSHFQDLKQQKFVIEAEPSELVCISIFTSSTSFFDLATHICDPMSEEHPADNREYRSPM
jgi:hypothetical protein